MRTTVLQLIPERKPGAYLTPHLSSHNPKLLHCLHSIRANPTHPHAQVTRHWHLEESAASLPIGFGFQLSVGNHVAIRHHYPKGVGAREQVWVTRGYIKKMAKITKSTTRRLLNVYLPSVQGVGKAEATKPHRGISLPTSALAAYN
jgi:hypothetical protein